MRYNKTILVVLLFMVGNLYSQVNQLNKAPRNIFEDSFPTHEKGIDNNDFEKNSLENYFDQILSTRIFDSTSVVDSVIIKSAQYDTEKESFTYSSYGKIASWSYEKWEGSAFKKYKRETYNYDSGGNLTAWLFERWNGSTVENYILETYTNNSSGNRTSYLEENWFGGEWKNSSRGSYAYDSNENVTADLSENWDGFNWLFYTRYTYSYDINSNRNVLLLERWDENSWKNSKREIYTFNFNQNITSTLYEQWDGSNNWLIGDRHTRTYDLNGNMTSMFWDRWELGNWVPFWQHTYTYDLNGKISSDLYEYWSDSSWVIGSRQNYNYDSNKNLTICLKENWKDSIWVDGWKNTYTYDLNGNMISGLSETWDGSSWVQNKMGVLSFYDSFGREYNFLGYEINVYYSTITDVEETEFNISDYKLSRNYPNPFNPSTTIKYNIPSVTHPSIPSREGKERSDRGVLIILKVYDILGREVATLVSKEQKPGNYEVKFDASNLTSGLYFYRITAGSFMKTMKMILLK